MLPRIPLAALALSLFLVAASAKSAVIRTEHFTIEANTGTGAVAERIANDAEQVLAEVAAQLGALDLDEPPIHVRVVKGGQDFADALGGSKVSEWAAGVAYPSHGLIVLRVDAQTQITLDDVFRHEVSHVVLGRAVRHRPLPHWFIEGVAVHQAGEQLLERWARASAATLTDSLVALVHYEDSFPRDSARADFAYAQSTAFLTHLLDRYGWRGIRTVVKRVRDGERFHAAFRAIYGGSVPDIEREWRHALEADASWLPILTGTTTLWFVCSLLFVASWWVKRRKARERLAILGRLEPDDEFA